jgi:flavin reductase (DIM6/NTAB) family NADH-FMN oxidoreductase RutF
MPVSPDQYKDALRHFASGVTIVTIKTDDEIHGLTVSAFASISPEPPLISIMIDRRHHAFELIDRPDAVFAVNILGRQHEELSNRFAFLKSEDRFAQGEWTTAQTGAPILADCLAWLDCSVHSKLPAGTHTIYVGQVEACEIPDPDGSPLVYWNRGYRQVGFSTPE